MRNSSGATGHLIGFSTTLTHQPPALPGAQVLGQRQRAFDGVEVVDGFVPFVLVQAGGLLGVDVGAGGDDQKVVIQVAPVLEPA